MEKRFIFFTFLCFFFVYFDKKMRKPLQTKKNNLDKTAKDTYNKYR